MHVITSLVANMISLMSVAIASFFLSSPACKNSHSTNHWPCIKPCSVGISGAKFSWGKSPYSTFKGGMYFTAIVTNYKSHTRLEKLNSKEQIPWRDEGSRNADKRGDVVWQTNEHWTELSAESLASPLIFQLQTPYWPVQMIFTK
jgi:hypothetical protein